MRRLVCLAVAMYETLTWPAFWRSLIDGGPLVVADGHLWPWPIAWAGVPEVGEGGLIERDLSRCARCGRRASGWRRWWGQA